MTQVQVPEFLACIAEAKGLPVQGCTENLALEFKRWVTMGYDLATIYDYYVQLKVLGTYGSVEISSNPWNLWIRNEYGDYFVSGGTIAYAETYINTALEIARAVRRLLGVCEEKWKEQLRATALIERYTPVRPLECYLRDIAIETLRAIALELPRMKYLRDYAEKEYNTYVHQPDT